jgi:hemolysin activation/secretion protein
MGVFYPTLKKKIYIVMNRNFITISFLIFPLKVTKLWMFGVISSFLLMYFLAVPAHAQVTPADQQRALRNLEQNQQKQENFLKSLEDKQEQEIREKKKPKIEVPGEIGKEEVVGAKKGKKKEPCFDIKTVELKGATILKDKELDKITKLYAGTCMGIAEINELMHQVTNFYVDKGYVTTRVAVPQQDLKSGNLQIMVMEGTVEDIILNENSWRDKAQVAMAFPFMKGKVLNLRDIEQGLDQLNRLASSAATMQLVPGDKQSGTKVVITNKPVKPNRATLGFDNSGQNSTGKNKGLASLERDNLLGLGEAWSFNYNEDTAAHNGEKGSEVYAGNFSLPFGYWTLSENASHSEYLQTIVGTNETFQASGQTDSSQTRLDRVIYRNQDSKVSLNTSLKLKDIKAFTKDVLQTASGSTYSLSIWTAGMDYTLRALGAVWSLSSAYERGLDALGARVDASNITASSPHAQFNKYTLDASVYKPFTIAKANLAWRTAISGQKSPDHLFGSERISLGDRYTVRGFDDTSISGDSGGYIRNDLSWNLPQFTENKYANFLVGNLQPYIGFDAGTTKLHLGKDSENTASGYVSGWATGIRNNSEWLSFDLAYAQAINAPASIATKTGEVYFTVSAKIGF